MERRKLNISFTKSGQGNISTRIILPTSWIKELGISQENREVFVYKLNNEIIIRTTPLDFDKKEAIKLSINEIKKILSKKKYYTFADEVKVVEKIILLYFEKDSKEYKKYFNAIIGGIDDWNVDNTNLISFENQYYYYIKDLNFSNFEEFEKYFNFEIDLPLKHELIENEDDVSYICTTCGRIYLKCISDIKEIAIWKE